jgi:sugar/nucleoside kinase (ribokinase family)
MPIMNTATSLRFIISGKLQRDYLLLPDGEPLLDTLGGSLVYAAAGLALWESRIGLLGRVGQDYPQEWLGKISQKGFDTRGICVLEDPIDLRSFCAYSPSGEKQYDDPVAHFARWGYGFPKSLLGYQPSIPQPDNRARLSQLAPRVNDIPSDYLDAGAVHICPMDYLAHSLLPSSFRQRHIATITLDPSAGYMNPIFWDDIPPILTGLTAFITNEDKLRNLFLGRSSDVWEMAETLAGFGCELVVVKRAERGQILYDGASRGRWVIPAYPAKLLDPTGSGDAFCGGFLAGYRQTYDPLQAVLYGNIAAAFTIEGKGAFFAMDAMQRLAEARREALKEMVRRA